MELREDNSSGLIFSCSAHNNDGNFRSLLRFRAQSRDLILKDHLKNSAANAVYISRPLIQNELIRICCASIQTQIVTKMKNVGFFFYFNRRNLRHITNRTNVLMCKV
jgi:hypothetical protein